MYYGEIIRRVLRIFHSFKVTFALQTLHRILDELFKGSEVKAQLNQLLRGTLGPHHPRLFVLFNPIKHELTQIR